VGRVKLAKWELTFKIHYDKSRLWVFYYSTKIVFRVVWFIAQNWAVKLLAAAGSTDSWELGCFPKWRIYFMQSALYLASTYSLAVPGKWRWHSRLWISGLGWLLGSPTTKENRKLKTEVGHPSLGQTTCWQATQLLAMSVLCWTDAACLPSIAQYVLVTKFFKPVFYLLQSVDNLLTCSFSYQISSPPS